MSESKPAEPSLFSVGPDGAPALMGRRCRSCGHRFFPAQDLGCERCGARPGELAALDLATTGTILVATTAGFGPGVTAGTVLGEIALDDGPVIQAILHPPPAQGANPPRPGTRVRGLLVPGTQPDTVELRFEVAPTETEDSEESS